MSVRSIIAKSVSLLFIALLAVPNAQAQTDAVTPTAITTCAPITINVSGFLPCANQTFNNISSSLVGNDLLIEVYFTQPQICLPAIVPFAQSINVGALPPGAYSVTTNRYENFGLSDVFNSALTVTFPVVDTAVTLSGGTLMATQLATALQWLDCGNGWIAIPNETSSTFTPGMNGSYAVEVTMNGCTDTSACVLVVSTGMDVQAAESRLRIYPNPTSGGVMINLGADFTERVQLRILDANGREVQRESAQGRSVHIDLEHLPSGPYVIEVEVPNGIARAVVVRE